MFGSEIGVRTGVGLALGVGLAVGGALVDAAVGLALGEGLGAAAGAEQAARRAARTIAAARGIAPSVLRGRNLEHGCGLRGRRPHGAIHHDQADDHETHREHDDGLGRVEGQEPGRGERRDRAAEAHER